jgi:fluoride exporter
MLQNAIAVALGSIAGALSRYYIGLYFGKIFAFFPMGTFFVNVTGSFLMGFFMTLVAGKVFNFSPELVLLIATGFLGSYTTFSSYELDTFKLIGEGVKQTAVFYWLGSPIMAFIALQIGVWLGQAIETKG